MKAADLRSRRRLHHAAFLQPRQPAFWLFVLIVGLTSIVAFAEQNFFRDASPGGWALSWILLALYGLPVAVVVYLLDLYEREPAPLLVAAFIWGAVAATTLSAIGNAGWGLTVARLAGPEFAARWTAALTAPFVEEILKGCGIVLIYLIARDEVDDVMDGFVYGAICGLGFAIVEDVVYFMAVFGGQPSGVLQGFWVRVVASGLYGHVLYTGLVGMAVGIVVSRRSTASQRRRLWPAAGLCALAAFAHFLWNSPLLSLFPAEPWSGTDYLFVVVATAVKGLPLLAFVAIAVTLARRRERRWLHRALDGEVGLDGISQAELRLLESPSRRRAARGEMRRRAGTRAAGLLHRLQREQVNLAMVASRVAGAEDPALTRQRAYCASLREALRAIPGAAPAAGETGPRRPVTLAAMDVDALVRGVLAGDRRAVARAISAVEDGADDLEALSEGIFPSTGRAATIGLTGAPGVGKSTLAAGLVRVGRARDLRAAVLAVDPTSPYTGGALLGDRVRMQEHATDPSVFIRSMATRGHLGGMALAAPEAVRILDAAGYDRVVVETVGVGQAEVDVAAATDTAVVVLAPGMGDAVQMAKAGILEVADVFVVNKADREGALEVVRELRQMLHLGAARDWDPPVLTASAIGSDASDGIDEVWEAIESHRAHLEASGALGSKRRARLLREVEALAAARFHIEIARALDADPALADDLVERRTDPYGAAAMLVRRATGQSPRGGPRRDG